MKVFISEEHRQNARRIALINIALFFSIKNLDTMSNDNILMSLANLKDKSAVDIFKLLKDYFIAYDKWFVFYQKIKKIEQKTKSEYSLNEDEKSELSLLIEQREISLNALQEKFDELQLSRFNLKTFGNNISGIVKN